MIGVDGSVKASKITQSSGFRDLDKAALVALGKCRFKPAIFSAQALSGLCRDRRKMLISRKE